MLRINVTEVHADRCETLPPPDFGTHVGVRADRREDATLVEHHVHVILVPLRREDPARDAEGWPAVMVLLDRLG